MNQARVVDEKFDSFTTLLNISLQMGTKFILKDIGDENWLNSIIFVGV